MDSEDWGEEGDMPQRISLDTTYFWIHIHNIPYGFSNLGYARKIGNYLGKFLSWDDRQFDEKWEAYMRIRVTLDVRRPLKVGTTLKKSRGEGYWVDFKYEKLPSFCFACGVIGHAEKFCPSLYDKGDGELVRRYGPWLRAGGGRSRPTMGNKWLVGEGGVGRDQAGMNMNSFGNQHQGQYSLDNQKQEAEDVSKVAEAMGSISGTGEQKRRRTWEERGQELKQLGEDAMVLEDPKNRVEAGWGSQTRQNQ
ncbi:unnamed protein product [Cuscuta europaea]|uniref:CCHC-type domain-containing protein n=1 Tax=Cuscuta europaea TaxID=41803 RepID=A0A9P0YXG9_CUSEU|nr:unnamed protein product [Cuscuta europaea]